MSDHESSASADEHSTSSGQSTTFCPFCNIHLAFPAGATLIQCPQCHNTLDPNASHQIRCQGCSCLLAYPPNSLYIQCPRCLNTMDPRQASSGASASGGGGGGGAGTAVKSESSSSATPTGEPKKRRDPNMPKAVCNAYMVFCIGAGSAVNLASGTSAPIEEVEASSRVLARHEHGLASRRVTDVLHRGHRECVELLFDDGRNLVCTPDHRILAAAGPHDAPETRATWTKASDLIVNKSYVSVGVEYPLHERAEDAERCVAWALRLDELDLTLNFTETRSQTMAFARLLGYATSSRAVLQDDSCDLTFDHQLDADCAVADMQLLTGVAPVCSSPDEDHQSFRVTLPSGLLHAFRGVSSDIGDRRHQSTHLPSLLLASECPLPFIREFLGGLFGGAGTALSLSQDAHNLSGLALRTTKQGTVAQAQHGLVQLELCPLLARVGIDTNELALSCSADMADLRDDTSYDVNLSFGAASVMPFARRIGFRFSCGKQQSLAAATAFYRSRETTDGACALQDLLAEWGAEDFVREQHSVHQPQKQCARDSSPTRHTAVVSPPAKFGFVTDSVLPLFRVKLVSRRSVGVREVFDLSVPSDDGDEFDSFTANGILVHNCKTRRNELKYENPDLPFGKIGAKLGEMWRNMSPEEKRPYDDKAAVDRERYRREMIDYQSGKSDKRQKKVSHEDDDEDGAGSSKAQKSRKSSKHHDAASAEEEEEGEDFSGEGEEEDEE